MSKKYAPIDLTDGSVSRHVIRMAPPMAVAFLATMVFNIVDTWFVSRLGDQPLAAMGFTFPVVMFIHSITIRLELNMSAAVSQAFGKGDRERIRHLASAGLLLGFIIISAFAVLGLVTMDTVFGLLGAKGDILELTRQYMRVWFWFLPVGVLPMVGNNAIRATGDTFRPSIIMVTGAILNCILDPIMIFGVGFFPAMGMAGAALATGISRSVTLVLSLAIMHRFGLLTRFRSGWHRLFAAWATILRISVPATATNLLMPLTNAVITRIIAGFGTAAIAATAAGQRVEMFAFLVPMAMGSTLVPLIGQNWGARRLDRVRRSYIITNWYGFAYIALCFVLILPLAPVVASWFSESPDVTTLITDYLRIILAGAMLNHIVIHTGFALNAVERPAQAAMLNAIRLLGLVLPLAWAGSKMIGIHGVFFGTSLANLLSGTLALIWFLRLIPKNVCRTPADIKSTELCGTTV